MRGGGVPATLPAAMPRRPAPLLVRHPFVRLFSLVVAFALPSAEQLCAQGRPVPPGGGGGGGGGGGNAGGGGGAVVPPIIIGPGVPGGGGGGGGIATPTAVISAPRGGLVDATLSATAGITRPPGAPAITGITYQWNVSGARIVGDNRGATVQFVAERSGTVSLNVAINSSAGGFNATADVMVFAADTAGAVTAPASVPANTSTVTATVPAAQGNDRTFRWTVSGDAAITAGQGSRSITLRPGSPGLKEITCNVTLRNVVSVPVRAYLVVTGTGAPSTVTVNQGAGGGTFPAGTRVDIFAHPPPAGHVFDRWTGDTAVLGAAAIAPFLPHATLTVPPTPVTLTATYKPAPAWNATVVADFNPQTPPASASAAPQPVATSLSYHIPGDARGLVFLLHDTGGGASDWFNRPAQLLLVRDLVAAGYGVAALNSLNRTTGAWTLTTPLAPNADLINHFTAHESLVAQGKISSATPLFFLGVGRGANAAISYADQLATSVPHRPVKGAVLYLSGGLDTLAVTSRVPQFFASAANDDSLVPARDNFQLLVGRGVATGMASNPVSPAYAARFRSLALTAPEFSASDADAVWSALQAAGILDANSYPKHIPSTAALTAALPAAHRGRVADVAAELAIAAAGGEFYSDANPRIIQFLNARAADAPSPPPGRIVNLSARGKIAHYADSFTLGFTITGRPRAALLVRGIGPTLARFGVAEALTAPRLEIHQGSRLIAANEGWERNANAEQLSAAAASVGAFALPARASDAALLLQLEPGTYTATVRGLGGAAGDVLAEIYDVSRNASRLTNLSTLTSINNEGDLVIPGIVISGNNPRTVVVRAVGAGLADFGYTPESVLADPRLTVLRGNQTIAQNNNWGQTGAATLSAVFPAIGAFPLRAAADAAVLEALPPGNYTLQAGAAPLPAPGGNVTQTGAVLVEVYEVP